MWSAQGDPVKGEVVDANAGGAGAAVLWYQSGTARTLAADERLNVTDILFLSTAGGVFSLFFGTADGAGKRVAKGIVDAKGGLVHHFETSVSGPLGTNLWLTAAAGQIDCVISAYITKG